MFGGVCLNSCIVEYRVDLKLFEVFVCFGIEKKEADAVGSVFNLKGLLTETNCDFKSGLL